MSLFSVQLKVADDKDNEGLNFEEISETLFDAVEPMPDGMSLPVNEWRVSSMADVIPRLTAGEPVTANRITLDLRGFERDFPRLVVFLAPILYRWQGTELFVILPHGPNRELALASMGDLLRSLELRAKGLRIISCPTCARCRTDFPEMVKSIEDKLANMNKPLDVAVMGCEVNGPGEARAADIGIAFGDQKGMLFKNGQQVRVVSIEEAADVLIEELKGM